jgi:hypothetical protein
MTLMDDFDLDDMELEDEEEQEGESSNRTFILVAGILGAVLILALVCMAVYAMVFLPRSRNAKSTEVAEVHAQNTEVAMLSEATAAAALWTATPTNTATPAPNTPTASPTTVLAATDTPVIQDGEGDGGMGEDVDPRTATVAALFTQQAENALTITPISTELPETGFMEDVGVPGLVAAAASLVLVIFLARKLRSGM